jgi:hypothetical protein
MHVKGNMRPAETIPGMGEGVIKENNGRGRAYCKDFCKCHNVPWVRK